MSTHPLRVRFGKDRAIVAELMLPTRRDRGAVLILAPGMPSSPSKTSLLRFFSAKGYTVILPRYRGTWESDGQFLKSSPAEDLAAVIDGLFEPIQDVWNQTELELIPQEIFVIGCSFGGPAALYAAKDDRVSKVLCISPVVDFTVESPDEPMDMFADLVARTFGQAYRFDPQDMNRLAQGEFYSPAIDALDVPGDKVWILHAEDDTVVLPAPVQAYAHAIDARITMATRGGHLSCSYVTSWWRWRSIHQWFWQS
jgi:pimeloyl-ACP methyl ester carboxylesterase